MCCTPLLSVPLPTTDASELATRFQALADPTRLRLLSLVSERGDVCGCELVEPLGLAQPTISHHLKVLFKAGLLAKERRGRWIHYSIDETAIDSLRQALAPAEQKAPSS
jgi:ArsR family transcriptional regulator, arsenate/arsenite/antimonite-responsive transcriptional repressor